jgi:hypothetical protein
MNCAHRKPLLSLTALALAACLAAGFASTARAAQTSTLPNIVVI